MLSRRTHRKQNNCGLGDDEEIKRQVLFCYLNFPFAGIQWNEIVLSLSFFGWCCFPCSFCGVVLLSFFSPFVCCFPLLVFVVAGGAFPSTTFWMVLRASLVLWSGAAVSTRWCCRSAPPIGWGSSLRGLFFLVRFEPSLLQHLLQKLSSQIVPSSVCCFLPVEEGGGGAAIASSFVVVLLCGICNPNAMVWTTHVLWKRHVQTDLNVHWSLCYKLDLRCTFGYICRDCTSKLSIDCND